MNQTIHTSCLIKACNELGLKHKRIGTSGVFVEVVINEKPYHFISNRVPLNDSVIHEISKDKGHTYDLLRDKIKMPKTLPYLDPNPAKEYLEPYVEFDSVEKIVKDIEKNFDYPLIIKMNRGSRGDNVFKIESKNDAIKALKTIFDKTSQKYDYVALAQEHVDVEADYRVTIVGKNVELIYRKDNSDAKFIGNLSPLHWEGARAVVEEDADLKEKIKKFIAPILDAMNLNYAGLDVVVDKSGEMYLLEVNSHPAYNKLVEHCGEDHLVKIYSKVLESLH